MSITPAFLAARREARTLDAYPGEVPPTLEAAYAVQLRSTAEWGESVVGFKVGGIPAKWREQYPSPWLAGPVFNSALIHAKDEVTEVSVFEGGFAAYEPELVLRLGGLNAPRPVVTDLDVAKSFVRAVHLGAEIASSPLASLNALGPGSIISDFGNQAAVVVGPEIDRDWIDRLDGIEVATTINSKETERARVNSGKGGPLGALRFLLNHLRDAPYGPLPDEMWLASGAITGVHDAVPGSTCTLDYGSLGELHLRMVPRRSTT